MTDVRARTSPSARNGMRYLLCGLGLLLAMLSASCGNDTFVAGTPVITISDTSGDFTSYIITIDEIEMTRQDGTIVELPMLSQRVDLVELANFIEVMGAPAMEVGTYVSMTLFLDYTQPQVTVNVNGHSTGTTLYDPVAATVPTTQTLTVVFDPTNPLVISSQKSSLAHVDLDLAASTAIDYSTSPYPTVYVKSFATVNATPVYNKPIRARGLFVIADVNNSLFTMNLRPFHDAQDNPFGAMTIITNGSTYYNVNGATYTGAAGLTALNAAQNAYSDFQVEVYGSGPGQGAPFSSLSTITPSFVATAVYAGTSLESTIQDHLVGTVSAVSGNTVTVNSAELISRYGGNSAYTTVYGSGITFADSVPVTVGPNTIVSQDGVVPPTPLTTAAISVGQHVDIGGQGTDPTKGQVDSSFNPLSFDAATAGTTYLPPQVRLQSTAIWGTLVSAAPTASCNGVTMSLQSMDNLETGVLTFTGTGSSSATDAYPPNYCVATGSLATGNLVAGALFRADGFVAPFNSAPPDFNATAVTPGTATDQQLVLEWTNGGSTTPFSTILASGLVPNMADPYFNAIHAIRTGPSSLDVTTLPAGFTITPTNIGSNTMLLSIGNVTREVQSFNSAQIWADNIVQALSSNIPFSKLVATGYYDASVNTFYAYNISINE